MKATGKNFKIDYHGAIVSVDIYNNRDQKVFLVKFADRPPLFLTKAVDANNELFWTSIPEGRLQLAKEVGKIIDHRNDNSQNLF